MGFINVYSIRDRTHFSKGFPRGAAIGPRFGMNVVNEHSDDEVNVRVGSLAAVIELSGTRPFWIAKRTHLKRLVKVRV